MIKEHFTAIFESALLSFDGMSRDDIIKHGIHPKLTDFGIALCKYLKSKSVMLVIKTSDDVEKLR